MAPNAPVAPEKSKTDTATPSGFRGLRDEIDRMFHALSLPEMSWRSGLANLTDDVVGLRVDVAETADEIQITTDLPGVEEDAIDVSLVDDLLRIRAEKRSEDQKEDKDKTWHVVERSYGKFERAIRVPSGIDPDSVTATFRKGVLTVSLPKPPEGTETAKKITVIPG
jgi:HSP20 family protein